VPVNATWAYGQFPSTQAGSLYWERGGVRGRVVVRIGARGWAVYGRGGRGEVVGYDPHVGPGWTWPYEGKGTVKRCQ
jgi:hypothetical protein